MKGRRRQKPVARLKGASGEWVDHPDHLKQLIRTHFESLYTTTFTSDFVDDIFLSQLNDADKILLNRPVTSNKVETAIFQMGVYKAPGPDGFPPNFYQCN